MGLRYFLNRVLLSGGLLGAAAGSHAQAPASQPAPWVLKAGLRLTHLHYAHNSQAWQLLLPLSLGAEYRVAPRVSLYGQLEADLLASNTSRQAARRQAPRSALEAATLGLGLRYYYGRPRRAGDPETGPEFGKYLALEGAADWQQLPTGRLRNTSRRTTPAVLTPALYALWGIQNRLRPHALYDLNAGLGLLAPAQYNFERVGAANHWDVGAQVNIRLYFSL